MNTRVRAERIPIGEAVRYWVDDTCWAEIAGLDGELDRRLASADGWTAPERMTRGLARGSRRSLDALVELFSRSGLAVEGPAAAPIASLRLAVAGSGMLARAVAQALLRAGATQLQVLDPQPPDPFIWPSSPHATGADALVRALRPRHRVQVRAATSAMDLASAGTDLVLVAPGRAEADRWLLEQLVRHDLTHMVLGCHRDVGRIGPLVMPGRTPCVGCQDLARTRHDPHWPAVLSQLDRAQARPQPTLLQWVAARTVLEVGWLARSLARAEHWQGRVELVDLHYPQQREVNFRAHPDCGCVWSP